MDRSNCATPHRAGRLLRDVELGRASVARQARGSMIVFSGLLAPRTRQGLKSLALALLMAGIKTASAKVFRWKWRPAAPAHSTANSRQLRTRDLTRDHRLVAVREESEATPAAP